MRLISLNGIYGPVLFNSERFVCCVAAPPQETDKGSILTLTGEHLFQDIDLRDTVDEVSNALEEQE